MVLSDRSKQIVHPMCSARRQIQTTMSKVKRIFALIGIFVFATIAWAVLGATIFTRTYGLDDTLRSRVSSTWGTAQLQGPPGASYEQVTHEKQDTVDAFGRTQTKLVEIRKTIGLPVDSTRANVGLQLEHRQKGLLWYSTYKVAFAGEYTFHNSSHHDEEVTFSFPLPAEQAMYDNDVFSIDGAPTQFSNAGNPFHAIPRTQSANTLLLNYS